MASFCHANDQGLGRSREDAKGLPLPRDGRIAICEELEAALAKRGAERCEALKLFLARHPGDPLGEIAQETLTKDECG